MAAPAYDALKPQHQRFVDAYVESGNACDAYRKAGYKIKTNHALTVSSSRLMANVGVNIAVAERRQMLADVRMLTLKEKQAMLTKMALDNYSRKDGGEPLVALAALRELNKMEGDYAPTRHQSVTGVVRFIQQIEEQPVLELESGSDSEKD